MLDCSIFVCLLCSNLNLFIYGHTYECEREKAVRVFLWVVRVASHTCPFNNWDRHFPLGHSEC